MSGKVVETLLEMTFSLMPYSLSNTSHDDDYLTPLSSCLRSLADKKKAAKFEIIPRFDIHKLD